MKTYGLIMAGGIGSRFWPISRKKKPKQLLNLTGNEIIINETIDRLTNVIDKENIFIITNEDYVGPIIETTKERILTRNIISEPSSRNTAACIGYAAMKIIKNYNDGIMVIAPSDAYIRETDKFSANLLSAVKLAEENDKIVTIGITPTYPATGYGYIKYEKDSSQGINIVKKFKEKPDLETAKTYINEGNYLWNSGIIICKASIIERKFKELVPDIYDNLNIIKNYINTSEEKKIIKNIYPNIRSISIDYAILESTALNNEMLVVEGNFEWSDMGSWNSLEVLHDKDEFGNIILGDAITVDTTNCIIQSEKKLITTIGVDNLIIVETADTIMICDKNKSQDVKKVLEILNNTNRRDFL